MSARGEYHQEGWQPGGSSPDRKSALAPAGAYVYGEEVYITVSVFPVGVSL